MAAAEAAQQRKPLADVLEVINAVRQRVRLYAMLDTLEYIRRSGRVSWTKARLGELLRIKPFVEVRDGQVLSLGETRTTKKGHARLRDLLLNMGPIEKVAILHSNSDDQARHFLSDLPEALPENPILVNITSVIGTHVGPNGIGFAAVLR